MKNLFFNADILMQYFKSAQFFFLSYIFVYWAA